MKVWRGDYLAHSGCQTVFPRLALGGGWSRLGWVTMGLLVIQSLSHCNLVPCHYPPGQGYQGWGWVRRQLPMTAAGLESGRRCVRPWNRPTTAQL